MVELLIGWAARLYGEAFLLGYIGRFLNMRRPWLLILVAGFFTACSGPYGAQVASPAGTTCTVTSAVQIEIHLSVSDNGRSITTHQCDAIDVLLAGPPAAQWQTVQSSDEAALAILPIPLPAPPPGGTHEVYRAQQAGSAVLSSVGVTAKCLTSAAACPAAHWAVTVTVAYR
jgi:hypothetical protein